MLATMNQDAIVVVVWLHVEEPNKCNAVTLRHVLI